jgi:hypothetical protein
MYSDEAPQRRERRVLLARKKASENGRDHSLLAPSCIFSSLVFYTIATALCQLDRHGYPTAVFSSRITDTLTSYITSQVNATRVVAEEEVEHLWTSKAAAVRTALRRDGVELQYWATPLFAAHALPSDTVGPCARPLSPPAFQHVCRVHVRRGHLNIMVRADGKAGGPLPNYHRSDAMPNNFRLFKALRGEPLDASPPPRTLPPPPSGMDAGELPTGMWASARAQAVKRMGRCRHI